MLKSKKGPSSRVDANLKVIDSKDNDWIDYLFDIYEQPSKRPSWDDMFIEIAKVVSKRSKDPKTKVGAVIVKDKHILSIGYNAEPRDFSYEFDWNSEEKYQYVIHAELNAIANATFFGNSVAGSTIYLTLSPCHECMKLLAQNGIKTVYYVEAYKDIEQSRRFAEYAGIKLIKYSEI